MGGLDTTGGDTSGYAAAARVVRGRVRIGGCERETTSGKRRIDMTTLQPRARDTVSTVETMDFHSDGRLYAVDLTTNTAKLEWAGRIREVEFGTELREAMASFDGKWVELSGVATFDEVAGWMRIDATEISKPTRYLTADEIIERGPLPEEMRKKQAEPLRCSEPFDVDDFLEAIYESSRGRSWKESKVS